MHGATVKIVLVFCMYMQRLLLFSGAN